MYCSLPSRWMHFYVCPFVSAFPTIRYGVGCGCVYFSLPIIVLLPFKQLPPQRNTRIVPAQQLINHPCAHRTSGCCCWWIDGSNAAEKNDDWNVFHLRADQLIQRGGERREQTFGCIRRWKLVRCKKRVRYILSVWTHSRYVVIDDVFVCVCVCVFSLSPLFYLSRSQWSDCWKKLKQKVLQSLLRNGFSIFFCCPRQ